MDFQGVFKTIGEKVAIVTQKIVTTLSGWGAGISPLISKIISLIIILLLVYIFLFLITKIKPIIRWAIIVLLVVLGASIIVSFI
jgi:hypothetical protein